MMRTRLVAYTVLGDRLGVIPDSLVTTTTCPFGSDLATLQIDYPAQGRRHALLETKPEVAVEWWDDAADEWTEPDNARFHVVKRSWNSATDEESRKYDAVGIAWLTRKARVWTGTNMNASGQRQWNALSPGAIVGTVFDDAQARGWGPGLTRTFTDTHDSAGVPWVNDLTIAFAPSDAMDAVISALVTQGVADVSWTGRALNLYNPDATLGRDLTLGDAPVWVRHSGVTSAPEEGTIEDLTTAVRIAVDNGGVFDMDNPEAVTTYGRLETYQTQSGVTDEATVALLTEQALKEGEAERIQFSREFNTEATTLWPWRDYRPGDWVFVDREDGNARSRERVRVQQISLTRNEDGVSGHVTLGTRLDDFLTRLGRRTAAIVAGSTGEGGSGTAPIGADQRPPARVIGLVGSSDAYIDTAGNARARVVLDWSDITVDTAGILLSVSGYEVWGRHAGVTDWSLVTTTVDSFLTWSPFETAQDWDFRVRAISSNYVAGEFSSTVTVVTGHDVTPPPAPSAPIVSSRLRTVSIAWDGKSSTGGGMPRDFERVDVIRLNITPGVDSVVATLRLSSGVDGVVLAGGLPAIGDPIAFRLRAYDRTGNGSDLSATTTVDIEGITGPDLEANSVTANSIDAGAIDGMLITGATFRTAAGGERVELTTGEGLVGYAPDGVTIMTQVDATTGRLSAIDAALRGSLTTVSSGNGSGTRLSEGSLKLYSNAALATVFAELRTDPGAIRQYVRLFPPYTAAGAGGANSFTLEGTTGVPGNMWIYTDGGAHIEAVGQAYLRSTGGPVYINAAAATAILAGSTMYLSSGQGTTLRSDAGVAVAAGQGMSLTAGGTIGLDAGNDVSILGRSTNLIRSLAGATTVMTGSFFRVTTGGFADVAMQVNADGSPTFPRHEVVTSGSTNVNMTSGGTLRRVSSSARYKDDITGIEELLPVDAILRAAPVIWLDKGEVTKHQNGGPAPRWSPGVIAEQLVEAGLEIFVTYDLPEHGGEPNGVAYERLIAAVIPLLRDHHHRIAHLEGAAS